MKILHVGKFYAPVSGGIEKVLQVLCEADQTRVESTALVANTVAATVRQGVNGVAVTRVASLMKIGAVALCPTFPLWMRRLGGDVMVIHEPNPVALVAHALARPRTPLVVWFHAEVVRPAWRYRLFYQPFLTRVLKQATHVVVASPAIAEHAEALRPVRNKCVVIPFAVHPDQHRLTTERQRRVAQIRSARPEPLVLFVGRMVPYKGVDVLLQALVGTSIRAILVGNGPMRSHWQMMARSLELDSRVTFAGEVDDEELACLYNACDIFVLPSVTKAEAFGMVQLEAMACGKPVISTNLRGSGVPWVNEHERTGIVVPPGDATALRLALTALAGSETRRTELGRNGRARVIEKFSVERFAEQTYRLYVDARNAVTADHRARRQPSTASPTTPTPDLKTP